MIQGLFDNDEERPQEKREEEKKPESEIQRKSVPADGVLPEISGAKDFDNVEQKPVLKEYENYGFPVLAEISSFPDAETIAELTPPEMSDTRETQTIIEPPPRFDFSDSNKTEILSAAQSEAKDESALFGTRAESTAETARKSGLAWAAAIALFGSVVFCLVIGWFADLLLGTSPWGIIGGITLGSIVGFVQFFRMTSQIHKK